MYVFVCGRVAASKVRRRLELEEVDTTVVIQGRAFVRQAQAANFAYIVAAAGAVAIAAAESLQPDTSIVWVGRL